VTTRAKYRQTLGVVEDELGDAAVTGAGLAGVVAQRWPRVAGDVEPPRRDHPILRALLRTHLDPGHRRRRRAAAPRREARHTRSIALASLERLWERRDIDLRERTLWRLLYETAARADEVLRLDVEDLDIPAKRARTHSKAATSTGCSSARAARGCCHA
jgi:integrase